ncbi:MAG: flippase-like domain-containing protein [Muribaculaceae bacterium]|nr:flippase-like domain-containing protein [Muribaculaceae bacterium]
MKKVIKDIVRVALTMACSVLLVVWMFKKVDFHSVMQIITGGEVNYGWLIAVVPVVILSHVIRGYRWGIQLKAAGLGHIPGLTLACSIFGAYALNLVIPYSGEAWRIIWMAKRRNAPISTVLGTDIGDRGSDAVVVMMLLLVATIVGHPYIMAFLHHYPIGNKILALISAPALWIAAVAVIGIAIGIMIYFKNSKWVTSLLTSLKRMWNGFRVLFTMKGRGMYLVLTLGIWICYYMETYLAFFAFPFTRALITGHGMALGLLPALISFVFSSMSMLIPSNGGLGPWNLAVMFALSLFGISDTDGTAFSMLLWTTTSLTLVALGLFTVAYILLSHKPLPAK